MAALRGVFVHHGVLVIYNPIARTLSPSTPTTSKNPVVNSKVDVEDADSLQVSSEDITPILHVGVLTRALINLLLTHPTTPVCIHFRFPRASYSGDTILLLFASRSMHMTLQRDRRPFSLQKTNKLLMRRYTVVQKAHDADVFGILVGTLGVGSPPTYFMVIDWRLDGQRVSVLSSSNRIPSSSFSQRS